MYHLADELALELRKPLGRLFSHDDDIAVALRNAHRIITIGDVSTLRVAREVRPPDVAVVDYKTRRHRPIPDTERDILSRIGERVVAVTNAAGTISQALWQAIKTACENHGTTRIEVEGEEDLATLPAVALATHGTHVVYGQPDQGMVIIKVNGESQAHVQGFLDRMQEN